MQAIQLTGSTRTINKLIALHKESLRDKVYRVANRLHAVILNMEGRTAPQIADILKIHRSKVSLWFKHWQKDGIDGLLEGHRSGRPPEISENQREELAGILDSGPVAYGFHSGVWTCPMVTRVIEDEFSVNYHPAHVSRMLHDLGFSVQRPKKILAKADKNLQSKWTRYRYPNIKKKPKKRKRLSSSKTKQVSVRTPPSIKHGPEWASSPGYRRPGRETR